MTADIQPELSLWVDYFDGTRRYLPDCLNADETAYEFTAEIDRSDDEMGGGMTYLELYLFTDIDKYDVISITLLSSEEALQLALDEVEEQEGSGKISWRYVDQDAEEDASAERTYTVTFVDQHGDPVPGCVVNFCTDELCAPVFADDAGVATYTGAPYAYHLQVIKVPEGYSFDTSQEFTANPEGEALTVEVEKAE